MRRLLLIAAASAVLLAAAALGAVARPGAAHGDTPPAAGTQPSGNTVTTVGHGDVAAVPDRATVSAGVQTQGATASAALAANSAAMTKVVAALKRAGGTDLQTEEVSLSPQTGRHGTVTGYTAENSVSATAPIASAGGLIDAAVAAGANTVDGPSLAVSDQDALYRQALGKAVADARAKAQALAAAGGFGVGAVLSVDEQSTETPVPFAAGPAAKAGTPVEAGRQDVTADVEVSFAIR